MKKNNDNNSPNFGWHYRMHKDILTTAIKNKKLNKDAVNVLTEAVQKPDLDEFFLYGQNHFYYPNRKIKSYLDITGKHNAKALYEFHVQKMLNSDNALDEAGRALHYLQDMTQPNHIQSGSVLKKVKDVKMHHNFEMQTYYNYPDIVGNRIAEPIEANSFEELFEKTIQHSQQNEAPSSKNKKRWQEIAQQGCDLAISATKGFIELLQSKNIV